MSNLTELFCSIADEIEYKPHNEHPMEEKKCMLEPLVRAAVVPDHNAENGDG